MSSGFEDPSVTSQWEADKRRTAGDRVAAMRERSGSVDSNDPLTRFLYVLMRDHLAPGVVEQIMLDHVTGKGAQFTNGWLATYAADMAERLDESTPLVRCTTAGCVEIRVTLSGSPTTASVHVHTGPGESLLGALEMAHTAVRDELVGAGVSEEGAL